MNVDALPVTRGGVTRWESPPQPALRPVPAVDWAARAAMAHRLAIVTEIAWLDEQRARGLAMLAAGEVEP